MSSELSKISVVSKGDKVFVGVLQQVDDHSVVLLKARDVSGKTTDAVFLACRGLDGFDMANHVSEEMDEVCIFAPDLAMAPPLKVRKNIAELFGYTIAPNEQEN